MRNVGNLPPCATIKVISWESQMKSAGGGSREGKGWTWSEKEKRWREEFGHKERRTDSRALRHTPEKTERTRRLVLVYGSQNENVEETQVPVCPTWLRGFPKIVGEFGRVRRQDDSRGSSDERYSRSTLVVRHSDARIKIWIFVRIIIHQE